MMAGLFLAEPSSCLRALVQDVDVLRNRVYAQGVQALICRKLTTRIRCLRAHNRGASVLQIAHVLGALVCSEIWFALRSRLRSGSCRAFGLHLCERGLAFSTHRACSRGGSALHHDTCTLRLCSEPWRALRSRPRSGSCRALGVRRCKRPLAVSRTRGLAWGTSEPARGGVLAHVLRMCSTHCRACGLPVCKGAHA